MNCVRWKALIRSMAALAAFVVGSLIHLALTLPGDLAGDTDRFVAPVAPLREDELHRLYEAARVAKSRPLISRMMCMRTDGSIDAIMFEREEAPACLNPDDSRSVLDGQPFEKFLRRHHAWSLNNIEFLRSISTPEKAEKYLSTHSPYSFLPRPANDFTFH